MKTLNKVMLVGRIGNDPEIKYTHDIVMARFNLATDRPFKKDGRWTNETDWHRIVAWDKIAQLCEHTLSKGKIIFIEGQIRNCSWQDKDGAKKYITEIHAKDIILLSYNGPDEAKEEPTTEAKPITDDIPF